MTSLAHKVLRVALPKCKQVSSCVCGGGGEGVGCVCVGGVRADGQAGGRRVSRCPPPLPPHSPPPPNHSPTHPRVVQIAHSDWEAWQLSHRQIRYAAIDAFAVHHVHARLCQIYGWWWA